MAATIQLSRNTHVYIGQISGGAEKLWKIPVLDGFSFSQSTATTEVGLNEMQSTNGVSQRGRSMFTDALEPAEWSFSTYARPGKESNLHTAVEEVLWAMFLGADTWNDTTDAWTRATPAGSLITGASSGRATNATLDCSISNVAELGTFNLYFVLGGCAPGADEAHFCSFNGQTVYKLDGCVVNTAGIDFDIDGITTINWSGFGSKIQQIGYKTTDPGTTNYNPVTGANPEGNFDASDASNRLGHASTSSTTNFLRNRIASLQVVPDKDSDFTGSNFELTDRDQGTDPPGGSDADEDSTTGDEFLKEYNLTLTGGSINFENNITFLTPEELCRVNTPIGHITGTRTISGSFTCYLNDDDGDLSDDTGKSGKFFFDLSRATNLTQNKFFVKFDIGNVAAGPGMTVKFPMCHIDIPAHSIEDIISLETNFHALPTSLTSADDFSIVYKGA
tara:strand:+ start:518 stop:1861 length:1344 start_codon:yes stop_codon:yes gene_type:complete